MKRGSLIRFVAVVALFAGVALAFTVLSLSASPPASRSGTLRSLATIPVHELALLALGAMLGLLASAASRKMDPVLILLPVAFISLLDLDHLPAALGIAQPIRPAHSVFFVLAFVVCLWLARQPLELGVISVSAFLGHLGVDTGVFPLLSPFSFNYYSLSGYGVELLASSLLLAVSAGLCSRWGKGRRSVIKAVGG